MIEYQVCSRRNVESAIEKARDHYEILSSDELLARVTAWEEARYAAEPGEEHGRLAIRTSVVTWYTDQRGEARVGLCDIGAYERTD